MLLATGIALLALGWNLSRIGFALLDDVRRGR